MDTTEILIKIRKIVRSINLESKKIQKLYGVSIPQVLCLSYLQKSENYQATQGDIKRFLNLNSSTTSGIINRLESKRFIARLPKSGDKRTVHIALTSNGAKALEKIPPLLHDQLNKGLQNLNSKQLQQLQENLELLINLLEIDDIPASPLITDEELSEENNS
jgi:DNA-binding MarR family transcriptional regulator